MSLLNLIGNTPLVEIKKLNPYPNVKIYGKLEGHNPGGSVKDRAAYGMIMGALERGDIKPGDKLVEATSGNTGIALAMIACLTGIEMNLIMPDDSSEERVKTMRAFGANVILTPAAKTIEYSRVLADEMVATGEYFMLNQFGNKDNYGMHYKTTGPEIWRDTQGEVSHFVSAMGTTGTIMGVSKFLKEVHPSVTIVGTQPTEGSKIPGIRRWSKEMMPTIFDEKMVDITIDVSEAEARINAKQLALQEGIFSGMSSGGAFTAALKIAATLDKGCIVFIVCDRGDRYLSTDLFD
jgi:cysteine synthase B